MLNATATFEALMIILDHPPVSIPVHALPGLCERGGGDRGQQDPFQRLLAVGRLLFPHAKDPHRHGVLPCSRLIAGWQERHLTKGKLQLGRTCLVPMSGGNLERTTCLAWPGPCASQSRGDLFLALLHTPILRGTHQKVRLRRETHEMRNEVLAGSEQA